MACGFRCHPAACPTRSADLPLCWAVRVGAVGAVGAAEIVGIVGVAWHALTKSTIQTPNCYCCMSWMMGTWVSVRCRKSTNKTGPRPRHPHPHLTGDGDGEMVPHVSKSLILGPCADLPWLVLPFEFSRRGCPDWVNRACMEVVILPPECYPKWRDVKTQATPGSDLPGPMIGASRSETDPERQRRYRRVIAIIHPVQVPQCPRGCQG